MLFRKIKELTDRAIKAEQRAVIHFRKLYAIENIIKVEEAKKTPTVYIVEAIKKELAKDWNPKTNS